MRRVTSPTEEALLPIVTAPVGVQGMMEQSNDDCSSLTRLEVGYGMDRAALCRWFHARSLQVPGHRLALAHWSFIQMHGQIYLCSAYYRDTRPKSSVVL